MAGKGDYETAWEARRREEKWLGEDRTLGEEGTEIKRINWNLGKETGMRNLKVGTGLSKRMRM